MPTPVSPTSKISESERASRRSLAVVSASAGERVATGVSGVSGVLVDRVRLGRGVQAEDQHLRAEEQHGAVAERRRPVDATAVDEGAVGAAEVVDDEQVRAVVGALDARVQRRDGAVGEGQRRPGRRGGPSPDVQRQLGHRHEAGRLASVSSEAPSPRTITAP